MEYIGYPGGSTDRKDGLGLGPAGYVVKTDEWTLIDESGLELGLPWPEETDEFTKYLYGYRSEGPNWRSMEEQGVIGQGTVDQVLVTHGHIDHYGCLPKIADYMKPTAKIWASPQTIEIVRDGLNETAARTPYVFSGWEKNIIFGRLAQARPGEMTLDPGIKIFFFPLGHIPGAYGFIVKLPSGIKLMFLSDMAVFDQPVVKGADSIVKNIPEEWLQGRLYIASTDLTYSSVEPERANTVYMSDEEWGDKRNQQWQTEIGRFIEDTKQELNENKVVVVASLAVGRGQNLPIELARNGIPCYTAGSINRNFDIFSQNHWSDRDEDVKIPEVVTRIDDNEKLAGLIANLTDKGGPCVIVATSGFMDGGPMVPLLMAGLDRQNWVFKTTSYLPPTSRASRIFGKIERGKLRGERPFETIEDGRSGEAVTLPIIAGFKSYRPSAHSDGWETIRIARQLVEARKGELLDGIYLVHGTEKGKEGVAKLLKQFANYVKAPARGEVVAIG